MVHGGSSSSKNTEEKVQAKENIIKPSKEDRKRIEENKNDVHNDCFEPRNPSAMELFYTQGSIFVICRDDHFRGMDLTRILVDAGSQSNIIPLQYIDKLNARVIPLKNSRMKVANGDSQKIHFAVWLNINIAGTTWVLGSGYCH